MQGNAPKSEKEYHRTLCQIGAPAAQDWIIHEGQKSSIESIEVVKGYVYHRNKCEATRVVDECTPEFY